MVESAADWATITKRDGTETTKRSIVLRDPSGCSVEVTLWGAYASDPGEALHAAVLSGRHPLLAVKSARVGEFNGKTLSTVSSSIVTVDPDLEEAGRLRAWCEGAAGVGLLGRGAGWGGWSG